MLRRASTGRESMLQTLIWDGGLSFPETTKWDLIDMTVLEYKDSQFHECDGQPTTPITLTVDDAQKKLILVVPTGVSMIERRAAERNARAIQKAGFQTRRRGCIGRGYELEIQGHGGALPERLKHSPREVY